MLRRSIIILTLILAVAVAGHAGNGGLALAWGDRGDGTFANPVLNADYSDLDVIRVGDKYYMTCSEFHFMGMPVLESDDMVNWRIIGQVYDNIGMPGYGDMIKYAEGTWAPALRYHDGKFWIFVCTPEEGLFMTVAEDPAGPWSPLLLVKGVAKWEDPCPFWDDNGDAYLVRSRHRAGPIIIHRMSPDGRELLDEGVTVYKGPVAEGPKMFKKDGYYYISIPEGGVSKGWQTVLRSKDVYGPYESRRVLERGSTDVNGPHQGALVDTPDGDWWFYHFQSAGARGRVVHLQPVKWIDGFPFIGEDYDGNGVGEPMKICPKPLAGLSRREVPQTSDEFDEGRLGIQWQTNHNPVPGNISFGYREGCLTIIPMQSPMLRTARNQLTQKIMGFRSEAELSFDISDMKPGDRCGLECLGKQFVGGGVMVEDVNGRRVTSVYMENDSSVVFRRPFEVAEPGKVNVRLSIDTVDGDFRFSYSLDGKNYMPLGEAFEMKEGFWKGVRTGIYAYSTTEGYGKTHFDYFRYRHDGPDLSSQNE